MAFALHHTQKPVALDPHRFRVLCCGRRWGKTELSIDQIKARAAVPNSRIAYIAPTYQQARGIAWERLKNDLRDAASSINEARLEIRLVNGSIVILRGWEAIETLRGQLFDLIVIDEVAMMRNFMRLWQEVIRPTLTDRKGEAIFISTPKGFNHFYELYRKEHEDTDFKSFRYTTYDNPWIPKEEVDKAKAELTEDRFAQEYMADFRKTEGLVYKEFNRDRHIYTGDDPAHAKLITGVDFGYHTTCVLSIKKDRSDRYWVSAEWYAHKQTDAQTAQYTAAIKPDECYPDPESASGIEEMRRLGVNIREVIKNRDSVRNGISAVRELFKQNRLFIHASCENLIWELETYSYPEKRPDRNLDENPIKENDHAVDALRYALMMEPHTAETGEKAHHYRPKAA